MMNIKNISNIYSIINEAQIKSIFKTIIKQSYDSVCGLEIEIKTNKTNFTLITPPFIRNIGKTQNNYKKPLLKTYKYYEGVLLNPFFLPVFDELNGEFIEKISSLSSSLLENEKIFIQWLFSEAYNWENTALQMYSSYISGNNHPHPHKLIRTIQNKSLKFLKKIKFHVRQKTYIENVERKLLNKAYHFELRIVIDASNKREELLVNKLNKIFEYYDSFNSIRLIKIKKNNLINPIEKCMITPRYQILSEREILSLFGGNEKINVETIVQEIKLNNVIELLPKYELEINKPQRNIVQDIVESLKRVGVISSARIYDEPKIISGVRLTTVQFGIPKGKTLTDITKKTRDIQASLGVNSLSIEQGDERDTIKFSIPNENPSVIALRTLLEQESFKEFSNNNKLPFVVGIDELNNPIYLSLTKLPHLLVAGTTGSGKSVFLNSLITTLILTNSPQQLRMVLIDPKKVELQQYSNFPHVDEIITDMSKAESVLNELVNEMENRYSILENTGVKNVEIYNEKITRGEIDSDILPYIVCIVDEYADLKDTNKEVEESIVRLAQKSRAAGIHLIIATQRPSSDVISSRIKANIQNAVSFNLGSSNHYRTVFGTGIPYSLLGKGDGVLKAEQFTSKEFQRFQSPIISPNENEEEYIYEKLCEYLNKIYKNNKNKKIIIDSDNNEHEKEFTQKEDNENLIKLKRIIASTGITKMSELREMMGVKNATLSELMGRLVDEGWLERGRSKAEGYKLIANEEELFKYKKG